MSSMFLGVAVIYAAGLWLAKVAGMWALPAWTNVPGRAVRAMWAWLSVSVDGWGYRGQRRMRRVESYKGRHHIRRFERTYSARDKRRVGFRQPGKRVQTGV